MSKKGRLFFACITIITLVALSIAQLPGMTSAQQIIAASPGQTITYQGTGAPGSQVTIEISASIGAGVSGGHYISKMNGVNIPGGSSFSISASPVTSLSVSGSPTWAGGLGYSLQGTMSGSTGSASMGNVPAGSYNIVVAGSSSASSVTLSVRASQKQSVGDDGTYVASVSTSGLPSAVYTVKQNGATVAMVYLGVTPPATATPTPTPTAEPTITPLPNDTVTPTPTDVPIVTPGPNSTINPTPNATLTPTPGIWISATPTPGTGGGFFDIKIPDIFGVFTPATATPTPLPWTPTPTVAASVGGSSTPLPIETLTPTPTVAGGNNSTVVLIAIMLCAGIFVAAGYLLMKRK